MGSDWRWYPRELSGQSDSVHGDIHVYIRMPFDIIVDLDQVDRGR